MNLNENMKTSYSLRMKKEKLEEEIENLKIKIVDIDLKLGIVNNDILNELRVSDNKDVESDGLFATYFAKENIGYTNETEVINYLKDNGYNKFIKVKTTESLDKTPLKKEIKTNESLAKALEGFISKTITEYITVTDAENHAKMLEHIKEGK